jgi:hypothetical protein
VPLGLDQIQQTVSYIRRVHGDREYFTIFTRPKRATASFEQIHQSAIAKSVESRFQKVPEVAQTLQE